MPTSSASQATKATSMQPFRKLLDQVRDTVRLKHGLQVRVIRAESESFSAYSPRYFGGSSDASRRMITSVYSCSFSESARPSGRRKVGPTRRFTVVRFNRRRLCLISSVPHNTAEI